MNPMKLTEIPGIVKEPVDIFIRALEQHVRETLA